MLTSGTPFSRAARAAGIHSMITSAPPPAMICGSAMSGPPGDGDVETGLLVEALVLGDVVAGELALRHLQLQRQLVFASRRSRGHAGLSAAGEKRPIHPAVSSRNSDRASPSPVRRMPERHPAFDEREQREECRADDRRHDDFGPDHVDPMRPTSVEMRKPMPTIGVPKNSATIAPMSANVELSFSAAKTCGIAAGSRSEGVASHEAFHDRIRSRSIDRPPRAPRRWLPAHREERVDHHHRRLRLPVEAEHITVIGAMPTSGNAETKLPSGISPRRGRMTIGDQRHREAAAEPIAQPGITAHHRLHEVLAEDRQ